MFKKFVGGAALVGGLLVAGVVGFRLIDSPFTTVTKDHSPPPVLLELRDLADFHAAQAQFEVILDLEKDVKWVPSAIAGERVQFVGVGTVDAVVDFAALGAGGVQISDDAKSVRLTLPGAYAMEPVLDHDLSHVMNRDRGLLNRLGGIFNDNPTSEASLYEGAMNKMADAARQTDLIDRGQENTIKVLTAMLTDMGFEQIEVRFQVSSASV
ncbi:MAG: DUF4230 domain-containing protein [Actinomycetota bacterium]|nr:DUF4230 domain-containing protein [Actinomycetota bacterium]